MPPAQCIQDGGLKDRKRLTMENGKYRPYFDVFWVIRFKKNSSNQEIFPLLG